MLSAMRGLYLIAVVVLAAAAAPARADTVVSLGGTIDARAAAPTFSAAGSADASFLAGARLTLGFEEPPMPMPPVDAVSYRLRLVPELFAGFLSDSAHAEGYLGAGLRTEMAFASNRRAVDLRVAFYAAARGLVIGEDHDGAIELVVGEWLSHGPDRCRFGWEAGAMIRPRADGLPDDRELDAVMSLYVSRR
jgi:hypothetical protein